MFGSLGPPTLLEAKERAAGFRYMYYYIERDGQIFLLMVFNKNEQDKLTQKQKETLLRIPMKIISVPG